ncbi:MAG: UbiA family prenyltransferase [Alphaproteobacteria bacterium]|nr:UbiA family prenyltransferase [Alphaproteobacteria bacterium]
MRHASVKTGVGVTGQPASEQLPLVLDLDGSLLRTDLLLETVLAYLRHNPMGIFLVLAWFLRGRAHLKRQLGRAATLDVELLPISDELAEFATNAAKGGRTVGIATAADELLARRVARRFDFVDFVIASNGVTNLKGRAKAQLLAEKFPNGFTYAGDSEADIEVWRRASGIVLAGASAKTARAAVALNKPVEAVFRAPGLGLRGWLKALRVHQWAKNALVFVPVVLAGLATEVNAIAVAALAFFALGLVASGTYLINDLLDLSDDRRHWSKKNRPLASGRMGISTGVVAGAGLVGGGFLLAIPAGGAVVGLLAVYTVLTLTYSIYLKRQPILDVFTLASLFTLRLGVGIAAVGVVPSAWLLVFSMFVFASLSFAKRLTEIQRSGAAGRTEVAGRGYRVDDAPLVLAMGIAAGFGSVMIMVLYIMNDAFSAAFYSAPVFLWVFPSVMFLWISRVWLVCHRGELNDDPVAFAIKDRASLALGGLMGLAFVAGSVI